MKYKAQQISARISLFAFKKSFLESAINVSSTERWGAWRAQLSGLYCPGKGFATASGIVVVMM